MIVQRNKIFINCLFAFNALAVILCSTVLLIRRQKINFLIFAASVSFWYAYLPTSWDTHNNFIRIFKNPDEGLSIYQKILYLLSVDFGLPFVLSILIFSFLTIYIFTIYILQELILNKNISKVFYYLFLMLFMLCIEWRIINDIQKTSVALALVVLSLVSIYSNHKLLAFVILVVATIFHPFVIISFIAFLLSPFVSAIGTKGRHAVILLSILVVYLDIVEVLSFIFKDIPIFDIGIRYLLRTDARFSENINELILVLRLLSFVSVALICSYFISSVKSRVEVKIFSTIYIIYLFAIVMWFNYTFSERLFFMLLVLLLFVLVRQVDFPKLRTLIALLLLIVNGYLHATYTQIVIHREDYHIGGGAYERIIRSLTPVYMPPILLLNVYEIGYPNERVGARR